MVAIFERERPQDFSDVCGFADVIGRLERIDELISLCGQVYYLSGPSGVGKTTIARIIANRVADPCCIEEMDAQNLTVDKLREIQTNAQFKPLFGESYAYIINEFHNCNPKSLSLLLTVLEDKCVQKNTTWVFTLTTDGAQYLFDTKKDAAPLLGRMLMFDLDPTEDDYHAMALRICQIAAKYGIGRVSPVDCKKLIKDCGGSMRAAIQAVVSGVLA